MSKTGEWRRRLRLGRRRRPEDPRLSTARSAYEDGRWEDSARLWEEIFDDAPNPRARLFAGRRAALSHRRANHLPQARRLLKTLVAEFPDDPDTRRELARFHLAVETDAAENKYWHRRRRFLYVQVTKEIASRIARNARSILDVGSHDTPILEWFPSAAYRVSVDRREPYRGVGIDAYEADFLSWETDQRFDVGLCLQVLEHVEKADEFARRLIELCEVVIVSVPYRWPETASRFHVHDPVDEAKLKGWFGRDPNYQYRVKELDGNERLIAVYDRAGEETWSTVPEDQFLYRWTLEGSEALLADDG